MVKFTLLVIALLVAGVLLFAATRPDSFRVERHVRIAAPAEMIYPYISNLQRFREWSPYEQKDPAMQRQLSERTEGVGARYAWRGDHTVGSGSMTITDSQPPQRVTISLDFESPMEAHNTVVFSLQEQQGHTDVSWIMVGPSPFFARVMQVFFSMDKMVGRDFEAGLEALKRQVEQQRLPLAGVG